MKFKARKVYGQSGQKDCPFCGALAIAKNEQGLDVCRSHKKEVLQEFKCKCGNWLELKVGKFGQYFNCFKCGNMNYNKGMAMKPVQQVKTVAENVIKKKSYEKKEQKETVITTDDAYYFS
ncbi:hypothetical protein HOI26_02275 [Candidatus Woesearchaeota archaeon]|jgi:hypothetical protein|nr:hypothetical protein [Candidatus Woesearchaeota archaeon]MBT5739904.1 hypothetical protein [Candidatus Woesearchaeota archaeon]